MRLGGQDYLDLLCRSRYPKCCHLTAQCEGSCYIHREVDVHFHHVESKFALLQLDNITPGTDNLSYVPIGRMHGDSRLVLPFFPYGYDGSGFSFLIGALVALLVVIVLGVAIP